MKKLDTVIRVHLKKEGLTIALLEGQVLSRGENKNLWFIKNNYSLENHQLIISDSKLKFIDIFGMNNYEVKTYSLDI